MNILERDDRALIGWDVNTCDTGHRRHSSYQPPSTGTCSRSISAWRVKASTTPLPFVRGLASSMKRSPTGCRVFTDFINLRQPLHKVLTAIRLIPQVGRAGGGQRPRYPLWALFSGSLRRLAPRLVDRARLLLPLGFSLWSGRQCGLYGSGNRRDRGHAVDGL